MTSEAAPTGPAVVPLPPETTSAGTGEQTFWGGPVADLLARLATSPDGLSPDVAADRLRRGGPNILQAPRRQSLLLRLLNRFQNPLVMLLLIASGISAFTGDVTSFTVIVVVVLTSVMLDVVQEHKAGQAVERLRESVALRAVVSRGGREMTILARDLVPGDIIVLSAGGLVPADCRVLEARDCFVHQALLTGEPYPVEKTPRDSVGGDIGVSEAVNALFMGTSLLSGSTRAVVCRTGSGTVLGGIGRELQSRTPTTAFETGTRNFGLLILRIAILMVLFVLLVNAVRGRPALESFLFAVALAVGLTPELLPMIVSVTLSRGAMRMAHQRVIVKRLSAIHDLGSMDVLCSDKTGTLTEATIRLTQHLDPLGRTSARVLELAHVNSFFESGLRGPLDDAILRQEGVTMAPWTKLDEVPFGFERRRVSVLVAHESGERLLVVKGALEDVLALSAGYEADGAGGLRMLDVQARREIHTRFEDLSREGLRVLGVAWKTVPGDRERVAASDETDLVFVGFAVFEDPPKATASAALAGLARAGVEMKVVTGDNDLVTRHVCAELGIEVLGSLTGRDLETMDDIALAGAVGRTTLFCRVTPAQKNRVILALRRTGRVVGYLGDGINDAPSLHSADVGISVEGAVDVAREAADLILLDRDLQIIQQGVVEGRRTFGNIMKYIMMATSSNFGNMFSMAAASLVLPFLPLLPLQVLLNNLMYDVSELPIPMDAVDDEYLVRPRHWDMRFVRNFMLTLGPVSSVFDLLTFAVLLRLFPDGQGLFHTGWFIESLATQVLVIFVIRSRGRPFRSRPSLLLSATSLVVVALAVVLPFTPLAGRLGFVAPPPLLLGAIAGLTGMYLVAAEGVKGWFYRRFAPA